MPSKHLVVAALVLLSAACSGGGGGGAGGSAGGDGGGAMAMASDPAVNDASMAPLFEVDPLWPKPLPNHWLLGSTIGVDVDSREHVWIVHRGNLANNEIPAALDPPVAEECCFPAPPILEFDAEGNVVGSWGGPGEGYDWPLSNHGIVVDHMDNVWIGGNGDGDSHMLKFTRTGEFLLQVGQPGHREANSNTSLHYARVAKISFDGPANEMYVADGYLNKRVAVIDATSGDMKRFWGAYGNVPDDANLGAYDPSAAPRQQFGNPVHCADPTTDGFVYVCDRTGDRMQVFQKDGTFVDEIMIEKNTLGSGSVWDVAFSPDPNQSFLYVADGVNEKIHVIRREGLEYIYNFGDGGRYPGQFFGAHSVATDSQGNVYVTETYEGKRLQKFVYMGMGPAPSGSVGVVRPD
jgi:DNA-binding beta-propeller fold protein YncE